MNVCPVCKSEWENIEETCKTCGWSSAEDVTMQNSLFDEMQLADYLERFQAHLEQFAVLQDEAGTETAGEEAQNGKTAGKKPLSIQEIAENIKNLDPEDQVDFITALTQMFMPQEEEQADEEDTGEDIEDPREEIYDWSSIFEPAITGHSSRQQMSQSREPQEQSGPENTDWGAIFEKSMQEKMEEELTQMFLEDDRKRRQDQNEEMTEEQILATINRKNQTVQRQRRNLRGVLGLYLIEYEEMTGIRKSMVEEICDRIADGSFENLYVGDYFEAPIGDNERVRFVLAGFGRSNGYLKDSQGNDVKNYAIVIPEHCFEKKEAMQKSNLLGTNIDPFLDYDETDMHNVILPQYAKRLNKIMGGRMLHNYQYPASGEELSLLSYTDLYGDAQMQEDCIPLFDQFPRLRNAVLGINGKKNCEYWLRGEECEYICSNGDEVLSVSPNKKLGVRPYFYIG